MDDRVSVTDVYMWFLNPVIQWKLRREALKTMRLRSRDEILNKKFEWEQKMLLAEKQESIEDYKKFKHYLDVLYWILRHEKVNSNT